MPAATWPASTVLGTDILSQPSAAKLGLEMASPFVCTLHADASRQSSRRCETLEALRTGTQAVRANAQTRVLLIIGTGIFDSKSRHLT